MPLKSLRMSSLMLNTETNDEAAVASNVEAQEEQTQKTAEAALDVEPMDIFAEDGAESTAEDAVSTQKQTTAAEPAKKEQPEASEEDRRKRDEEAKRRAEAKRQADAQKKEEEARKAAERKGGTADTGDWRRNDRHQRRKRCFFI